MNRFKQNKIQGIPKIYSLAWFVLSISLSATLLAWYFSETSIQKRAHNIFQFRTEQITFSIKERLANYEQALYGGAGMFAAFGWVTREQWREFVNTLNIDQRYPGIQGIGFAQRVNPNEKAEHIKKVKSEGFPNYTITPEGERNVYYPIVYLEPFSGRNLRAFGYDMFSEQVRQSAMAQARDLGVTAVSGKVILVQETGQDLQNGFLMYLPVYRKGSPRTTLEEKRASIIGFVYSPFRIKDFLRGVVGHIHSIDFEIYDGSEIQEQSLLYDDNARLHLNDPNHKPSFHRTTTLRFGGRTWTLYFSTKPGFETVVEHRRPEIILISGIGLSFLFFAITRALIARRAEVAASQKKIQDILESMSDAFYILDRNWNVVYANEQASKLIRKPREQLIGKSIWDIYPEAKKMAGYSELLHAMKDHVPVSYEEYNPLYGYWLEVRAYPTQEGLAVYATDITARKIAEKELRKTKDELEIRVQEKTAALQKETRSIQLLQKISSTANQAKSVEEVLNFVLAEVCEYAKWPVGHAFLCHEEEIHSTKIWHLRDPQKFLKFKDATETIRLRTKHGLPGRVLAARKAVWVADLEKDHHFLRHKAAQEVGIRSAFAFPVRVGLNIEAVLEFFSEEITESRESILELMDQIGTQIGRVFERQRAFRALQESEEKFRSVTESANDAIVSSDRFGKILSWNKGAEKLFGYSEKEVLGKPLSILMPEHYRAPHQQGLERMHATGEMRVIGKTVELQGLRKDGTEFPLELSLGCWKTSEGLFFSGIMRDITERKNAEKAIIERVRLSALGADIGHALTQGRELKETLQQCCTAFVQHLDAAFARIWTLNKKENVLELQASAGMYTHLDGPHSRVSVGKLKIGLIAEERRPHITNSVIGDPRVNDQEWAKREGMVAFAGYPLIVEDRLVGVVAMFFRHSLSEFTLKAIGSVAHEIAIGIERKFAQLALEEKTEELVRSNRDLEQFAYVASHDLQEPLRMVSSFTEVLAQQYRGKLDPTADEYIRFIVDGAKRMHALVQDLLTYSRVAKGDSRFEITDCNKILEIVLSNLQNSILETQAIITHDPLPTLVVEPSQMKQLFQNLLSNAIKFRSQKRPEIHIGVRHETSKWKFSFKDNGIGIGQEYLERIFLIFNRLHTQEQYPGTGIGLAICKKVVEYHGGRIWVESRLGEGSTFHFTLSDDLQPSLKKLD